VDSEYYQGTSVRREHLYPRWTRVRWWQAQVLKLQSIEHEDTRGAGNCAVLKKVAALTVSTRILNAVSSFSVQSLPDLADRTMLAMMMVEERTKMTVKQRSDSGPSQHLYVVCVTLLQQMR